MAKLVEIMLSSDRFESEILTESVLAEGHDVEVVHDESSSGVGTPAHQSRLLVHATDADDVRAILNRSFPLNDTPASTMNHYQSPLKNRLIGIMLLVVMFMLIPLSMLLNWYMG